MLATSCSCSHYVQLISITIGLGMNRLRSADAVVYDRLSIPTLPLDLPDTVELSPAGKETGNHPVPQQEINALLLPLARMGKRVVRLKSGDPFVFARGGEELAVLRGAGIPCEAIPGVTAGTAVPAAADIPVTYRGEAVRLSAPHATTAETFMAVESLYAR